MDFMFGADDDDSGGLEQSGLASSEAAADNSSHTLFHLMQEIYIEIVKNKTHLKKSSLGSVYEGGEEEDLPGADILMHRHVCVVTSDNSDKQCSSSSSSQIATLVSRLRTAKFINISVVCASDVSAAAAAKCFDVVAICVLRAEFDHFDTSLAFAASHLVPGGLLLVQSAESSQSSFCGERWIDVGKGTCMSAYRKRSVSCNSKLSAYWSSSPENQERERHLLEQITVALSVAERKMGLLSDSSHRKAVTALDKYGVVVFRGMFQMSAVAEWGLAAQRDMEHVIGALRTRGLDFLAPREGQYLENYHEMSMREAFRCDLRNGTEVKKMLSRAAAGSISSMTWETGDNLVQAESPVANGTIDFTGNEISRMADISGHPAIKEVLQEVMNPLPADRELCKGNWGRYNFGANYGPGTGPPPLKVGKVGCVMSVPGCVDQTIHADTPHIYEHVQLPGHYYNLFVPAMMGEVQSSFLVGQTAFIAGSHNLATCTDMLVRENGEKLIEENLIRPHIYCGDALIFDCRVLHYGLANQGVEHPRIASGSLSAVSEDGWHRDWRPMLYMNHHRDWFHDPKNWNDATKLFPENSNL